MCRAIYVACLIAVSAVALFSAISCAAIENEAAVVVGDIESYLEQNPGTELLEELERTGKRPLLRYTIGNHVSGKIFGTPFDYPEAYSGFFY